MNRPVIEKTIEINASIKIVWSVFTDPIVTRQMGGEYVSDWKVGSSFRWRGRDGTFYTNGTILEIETEKLIKHKLLDLKDKNKLLSVITYEFNEVGEKTILNIKEEMDYEMTTGQIKDTADGWDLALKAVKETAEKI